MNGRAAVLAGFGAFFGGFVGWLGTGIASAYNPSRRLSEINKHAWTGAAVGAAAGATIFASMAPSSAATPATGAAGLPPGRTP